MYYHLTFSSLRTCFSFLSIVYVKNGDRELTIFDVQIEYAEWMNLMIGQMAWHFLCTYS